MTSRLTVSMTAATIITSNMLEISWNTKTAIVKLFIINSQSGYDQKLQLK